MKRIFFTFFLNFFFLIAYSQTPATVVRQTSVNNTTTIDAATNSVTILPNTLIQVTSGKFYLATISSAGHQVVVDWPKTYQIIQRNNANKAWVYFSGHCTDLSIDSVKVTAFVVEGGTQKTKKVGVQSNGNFEGAIELNGGDYSIRIQEYYANGVLKPNGKYADVNRVGVGEVIMLWGHSFMEGDQSVSANSTSARSRTVIEVRTDNSYNNKYFQNIPALPYIFENITHQELGPFNSNSWIAGPLADTLVNRLNVPVLIYGAAFGGSNIYQNKQNINNQPFGYTWFDNGAYQNNGFPFKTVQAAFQQYIPKTGIRCILAHHGVNDVNAGYLSQFSSDYAYVINRIRSVEANNSPNLTFFVAHEDWGFGTLNGQIDNLINGDVNIHAGIDLRDPATAGPWRDNGYGYQRGHFIGTSGMQKYLEFWKNKIPNSVFTTSTPKEAIVNAALKTP